METSAEKLVTKDGERRHVAILDAQPLDHDHELERERIHLLLLDDAGEGLADVAAGKVKDARNVLSEIARRRTVQVAG